MKTTLELPDDLVREIKIRAVRDNRKLKDAVADLLRRGLSQRRFDSKRRRLVAFPIVECAHAAQPGEEMTPARVADILLGEESGTLRGPVR